MCFLYERRNRNLAIDNKQDGSQKCKLLIAIWRIQKPGWLDFALACNYITGTQFEKMNATNEEIGKLLNHMINNPDKY